MSNIFDNPSDVGKATDRKEALKLLKKFLDSYKDIEAQKFAFQKSTYISEKIREKEEAIYSKISQINDFILQSYNDGIILDVTQFKNMHFTIFSIPTLRELIFKYYNFISSNNLTDQEFNDYRDSVISKIPSFMAPLIDYLFPKEIYFSFQLEQETLKLHPDSVNEEFRRVTKNNKNVGYLDLSREIRSKEDRCLGDKATNTELYSPSKYCFYLGFAKRDDAKKYSLNNHIISIKRKGAFVSDFTAIWVNPFEAWESEVVKNFGFWDESSTKYLIKPNLSTEYFTSEFDSDGIRFIIPKELKATDDGIKCDLIIDIKTFYRFGDPDDMDDIDKEKIIENYKYIRIEFTETNSHIRVPLNRETTYLYGTSQDYESHIFYGDYKLIYDFLPELYKFSIEIFNIIKEHESIFTNAYLKYLDGMIYEYDNMFSQMQQKRLETEENKEHKTLKLTQ